MKNIIGIIKIYKCFKNSRYYYLKYKSRILVHEYVIWNNSGEYNIIIDNSPLQSIEIHKRAAYGVHGSIHKWNTPDDTEYCYPILKYYFNKIMKIHHQYINSIIFNDFSPIPLDARMSAVDLFCETTFLDIKSRSLKQFKFLK